MTATTTPSLTDLIARVERAETRDCPSCCGNGEVVTDWSRYLHALPGDTGDEAVADCPDCDGIGRIEEDPLLRAVAERGGA